jgi:cell division protein FtsX
VTLLQALLYFFREAAVNLLRSWKTSLVAVLTIAVSVLVGGAFLLASRNVMDAVQRWRAEMRVVIYLSPGRPAADLARLTAEAGSASWVASA